MLPFTKARRPAARASKSLRVCIDVNVHCHSQIVFGAAEIRAGKWDGLAGITSYGDTDQVTIANTPVCGIEFYPACSR
jgi:hypothetical protein